VAGQETIGKALARSQYLWEVGRFRDSLKHLRDRLTNFPTLTRGIGQALSLFYYTAFYDMEELGAENYVLSLVSTATNDRRSTALEKFLAHRALALWLEGTPAPDMEIVTAWEEALSRFQALSCDGHHATPLVYGRLGDLFSVEEPDEDPFDFFFTRRRKQSQILRNARLAEFCYCKGIKADRQNRHCWFSLLSLYEKTGNKPKTNKTLDDIIKHFPEEKEAMFKAGIRCLERKAFVKGMNYLDQAQKLDPIDSRVRESFMVACILVALKQTQNGRLQKRRTALEKAEARADRTADDFNTGLCYLYARWAVMEALAGENDEAEQRMKKALSLAPNPLKLHYFTVLIGRMYGVRPVWAAESRRIADEALAGTPNPEVGVSLADVLRYLHSFQRPKDGWLDRERNKINRYLMKAAGRSCSREQAQAIIDYASHPRVKAWNLRREYVELMLRRNPEDARFRWARLIPDFDRERHPAGLHNLRIELATVLDLAHKQGEQDVAEQVERALKQVDRQSEAMKSISEFLGMDPEMDFDEPDNTYNDFLHSCEASEIAEGSSEKQTRKHAPEPCRQLNLFDFE
jgi:tetratricopeptide (TPR) repeat protein